MKQLDIEKSITITLTEKCNLNCVYCYEKDRSEKAISFQAAKEIIDKEMNMSDGTNLIHFDFFGGEPFIEFELLVKLVDYLLSNTWSKKYTCGISTNGTLVHGKIKEWLFRNKDIISVGLSFDGNKEMQNINRCNSFDNIDLDFFQKCWPTNKIKMTISQQSLLSLADGVIYLHQKGFGVNCNLAYGLDWSDPKLQVLLENELNKLIDFYLQNPQIEPCRLLSAGIEYLNGQVLNTIRKWCGTGTHMKAYDVSGNAYPCQFFMPLSMGKEKAKTYNELEFLEDIPATLFGDKCASCKLTPICPTCLGSNYCETGNLYKKSKGYCELQKIIHAANAYFKWKQYQAGQLNLNSEEEYRLLRGIQIVQESI